MRICDLHTHVLPGVDDGAQTMEQALQMLTNAAASDVEFLVVTPHCNTSFAPVEAVIPELKARFQRLQQAAAGIPVTLAIGAEVRVTLELPALLQTETIPTINDSRYLLTEFPNDFPADMFPEVLDDILSCGYVPLVAHPERYEAVCRRPEMVEQWLDMGCHIQITGGSIMGSHGKTFQRTAAYLLQNDFVACVASDAHGIRSRTNFLLDVYDHLSVYYSRQYAQCLMYTNPLRILQNEIL